MEITIGMKRILPTLLMSGLLCMLFATPVAAQTENSTLHPEATHGVALRGKNSRETTHTSQKKEQTSLSYKEEHKDTAPEVNAEVATFRSVALPLQNGQSDSTLRQEFDEQSSLQKGKSPKNIKIKMMKMRTMMMSQTNISVNKNTITRRAKLSTMQLK